MDRTVYDHEPHIHFKQNILGGQMPVTCISITILLTFENGCSVSSSLRLLNGDSRISPSAFFPSTASRDKACEHTLEGK
jgi:hypothetical protein